MRAVIVAVATIIAAAMAWGCQNEDPQAVPGDPQAPSSPVAGTTQIRWDADCDGTGTDVAALTLRPIQPNPATAPAGVPPFDACHVRLMALSREILAGTTIPVTFAFDRAGPVTVEALVQPSNAARPQPANRCYAGTSAAPSAGAAAVAPSGS
jgi:hypothetical protein